MRLQLHEHTARALADPVLWVLRQVLEQAVEWKLILRNPADSLKRKLPKVSEAERRVLDETEAAAFLKACNEKPHGLIFEFALLSGMRPEEELSSKVVYERMKQVAYS